MGDWKEYTIRDMADFQKGFAFKSSEYLNQGVRIIKVSNLNQNNYSNCVCLNIDEFCSYHKYELKTDDIVISTVGSWPNNPDSVVGKVARIPDYISGSLLNQNAVRLRAKKKFSQGYLYYLLSSQFFSKYIANTAQGSANQASITLEDIKNFKYCCPDYKEQIAIASLLQSFDDKIECNRRINENLEQQTQALFKSWFVDFETFKDHPFVESELGMIPQGWSVGTLGDMCIQVSEKVGNRNDVKVLSPVTAGELVLSEDYFTKQVYSESIAKYRVVKKGAFAYNPARVNIGSLGKNEFDFDGAVSPVYVVFECKDGYDNYFDLFRKTERFKTEVLSRAIGGVRQSLNYADFSLIQTVIAPKEVVDAFNPLIDKIKSIKNKIKDENNCLAELRDTLLPKLMSGEIRVPDTDLINEMLEKGIR